VVSASVNVPAVNWRSAGSFTVTVMPMTPAWPALPPRTLGRRGRAPPEREEDNLDQNHASGQ
jgi:hypothetical protein